MKTMSMRIRNSAGALEELGEDAEGAAESVTKLQTQLLNITKGKVNIFEADGETFKSTYAIMSDLSKVWDTLSDKAQADITRLVAGVRQGNVFSSLMNNFTTAEEVLQSSLNSVGSATAENLKYLDSIDGKMAQLKASFQALASETINSDFLKGIIDLGTEILSLVRHMGGLKTIFLEIGLIIGVIKFQSITSGLSLLKEQIGFVMGAFKEAKKSSIAFSTALGATKSAITATQLAMSGLVAVALIATVLIAKYNQNLEEERQRAVESAKATQQQNEALSALKKTYIDIVDSTKTDAEKNKELSEWKSVLIEQYGFEKTALEEVNGERQKGLDLIDKEIEKNNQKWLADNYKAYEKAKEMIEQGGGFSMIDAKMSKNFQISTKDFDGVSDNLKKMFLLEDKFKDDYISGNTMLLYLKSNDLIDQASQLEAIMSVLANKKFNGTITKGEESLLRQVSEYYKTINSEVEKHQESYEKGTDIVEGQKTAIQEMTTAQRVYYLQLQQQELDKLNSAEKENEALVAQAKLFQEKLDYYSKLTDNANLLNTAEEEMANNGKLSISTIQKIASLGEDYIQTLYDENGNLKLNTQAFKDLAFAEAQKRLADIQLEKSEIKKKLDEEKNSVELLATAYKNASTNDIVYQMKRRQAYKDSQGDMSALLTEEDMLKAMMAGEQKEGSGTDYNKEKAEKLKSKSQHDYDMGRISLQEHIDNLENIYKTYYSDLSKYQDEYNSYEKEVYDGRLKIIEEQANAQKEAIQAEIDFATSQKEKLESLYEKEKSIIQTQIDAKKTKLELIEKEREKEQNLLDLKQAQADLEKEKSKLSWSIGESGQMGYTTSQNTEAIQEAELRVQEAKNAIEKSIADDEISLLESQITALENDEKIQIGIYETLVEMLNVFKGESTTPTQSNPEILNGLLKATTANAEGLMVNGIPLTGKFNDNFFGDISKLTGFNNNNYDLNGLGGSLSGLSGLSNITNNKSDNTQSFALTIQNVNIPKMANGTDMADVIINQFPNQMKQAFYSNTRK